MALPGDGEADVLFGLREVLVVVVPDGLDPAEFVDLAPRLCLAVEIGDLLRDGVHGRGSRLSFGEELLQHPLQGELPHDDGILDGAPDSGPQGPCLVFPDGGNLEIGLRRQPAVEPELLFAEIPFSSRAS